MRYLLIGAALYLITIFLFYKMMQKEIRRTSTYIQTPSDYQIIYNQDSVDVYYYGKYLGTTPRPFKTQFDTLILNDQNLER